MSWKREKLYQRYTEQARRALQFATEEARLLDHEYIGTEHLLLGLIREPFGVASCVLTNLNVDLSQLRQSVEKILQRGPGGTWVLQGELPRTPRATFAIEFAVAEARNLNHALVGPGHLLLGLMRETEGVAAQILWHHGLRYDQVRVEVVTLLGDSATEAEAIESPGGFRGFIRNLFRRAPKPP